MMLRWEIEPFQSFGPLRMRQRRSEVQKRLSDPPYEQVPQMLYNRDTYAELGLLLYYDTRGRLEFINATSPCEPTLDGQLLIGRFISDVRHDTSKLKAPAEWDLGRRTLHFPTLGMALVAPADEKITGVVAYCEGYHILTKQWPD